MACAPPGGATCLPKILGETASELDVRFLHGDTCTPLLFPAYTESQMLQVLRRALWLTGALLLLALAVISFTVMRQVTVPLRVARDVAGRIAGGDLDKRMQVRGTDEMASLATSMNNMAAELERVISQCAGGERDRCAILGALRQPQERATTSS